MTPLLLSIVKQNLGVDAQKLSLSLSDFSVEDRAWIVNQIESRKKLKTKIKAWQKAEIVFPHELAIEQCSSELTARFKAKIFPKQNKVLDLTMGLGVDSYFFSLYHTHVTATEPNFQAYESAKHNFKQLNVENIKILNQSAEEFLLTNQDRFDLVFIDPSRRNEKGGKVFGISDCQPNMIELLPKLLKITDKIIIKLSPMLDVSKAIEDLNRLFDIYAVSVMNDCKELLLVIPHSKEVYTLNALELGSETSQMLTCDLGNEKEKAILGMP
ncbi:MAG: methyltransferase, partial [Cytophagales bacterium]